MSDLKTIIAYPYKGDTNMEAILEAVDDWFTNATTGFYKKSEQIAIWDIDSITDTYQLDLLAVSLGLYGWDRAWSLDEKKEKIKIGIELKRKIATPWCIKNVAGFVLDSDKIDQVNHPIQLIEGTGGFSYDGTIDYDGIYDYDSDYHWTKFSLIIPYDGTPTAQEIADVTAQVNNYKRLITSLVSISFVDLQTKFLHFPKDAGAYATIAHDSAMNVTGDMSICAKIWWEGFTTDGDPLLVGKGEFSPFDSHSTLGDNLSFYAKCEDNEASTTWKDSTGNGDGVLSVNSSTVSTASGKNNRGFDWSTGSYYGTIARIASAIKQGNPFSISFWFYGNGSTRNLFGNTVTSGTKGLGIYVTSSVLRAFVTTSAGNFRRVDTNETLSSGWNHCVVTYDGNSDPNGWATGACLYLNGVCNQSATGSGTQGAFEPATIYAGRLSTSYDNEKMDEICFWDGKELSSSEVSDLYNSGTGLFYGTIEIPWAIRAPSGNDPSNPLLRFEVNDGTGFQTINGSNMTPHEWVAIVVRKSGLSVEIDMNGTITSGTLANNGAGNTDPVQIMRAIQYPDSKTFGYLRDFVFYDKQLTTTERDAYINSDEPEDIPSGYVGYWRCNEEIGSTCSDEGASMPDMVLVNTVWPEFLDAWGGDSTAAAKISNYYPLDEDGAGKVIHDVVGNVSALGQRTMSTVTVSQAKFGKGILVSNAGGDYYDFESEPFPIAIDEPFSFGFWLKSGGTIGDRTLLDFINASDRGVFAWLQDGTNRFEVDFYHDASNVWQVRTSNTLGAGVEVFYVFTYDGGSLNTGMKTYIDGVEDSTRSTSGTVTNISGGVAGNMFKDNVSIGTSIPDLDWFDGFFICDDELTAAEVSWLYNRGLGLKYKEEE